MLKNFRYFKIRKLNEKKLSEKFERKFEKMGKDLPYI